MHSIRARAAAMTSALDVVFDYFPDVCPICQVSSEIKRDLADGYLCPSDGPDKHRYLQIIYRCPRSTCGVHFVVHYQAEIDRRGYERFANRFHREEIYPMTLPRLQMPESVIKLSPQFVAISKQALAAEAHGLTGIAGMGHRKALEFLLKDYCISKSPSDDAKIKKMPLMQCINSYITDANIKLCASRAVWLGNDETHYERIWTAHDIEDLKVLIRLTTNWIETETLTADYLAKMAQPQKL